MEEKKKSGVKGVTWNEKGQKWIVMRRKKYFGSFDHVEDAIKRRREIELMEPQRFCVICGRPIPPDRHPNATTCSDECVREKDRRYRATKYADYKMNKPAPKTSTVKALKKCEMCGESIPRESKARFCPHCSRERRSVQVMESARKMKLIKRGEIQDPPRICVVCGNEIAENRSRRAKTCSDECSEMLNKQRSRENYEIKHPEKKGRGRKPSNKHMQSLTITVPPEMLRDVRNVAKAQDISVSEYVRGLIQRHIDNQDEPK